MVAGPRGTLAASLPGGTARPARRDLLEPETFRAPGSGDRGKDGPETRKRTFVAQAAALKTFAAEILVSAGRPRVGGWNWRAQVDWT
jgi:hypothetical protein